MTKTIIRLQTLLRKQPLLLAAVTTLCLFAFILYGCKKNDFSVIVTTHKADFVQQFFTPAYAVNNTVARCIAKLQAENDRTGFVNELPANCGLPVWDKLLLKKQNTRLAFTAGDGADTIIIVPLTNTNVSLSGILIAQPIADSFSIKCYTNNWLYNICHTTPVDTNYASESLAFFMYMENQTFGTQTFYHIPAALINAPALPDSNGTKTVTIADVTPSEGFVISTVCIEITCPPSIAIGCIPKTVCISVPGDGAPAGGGDGTPAGGNTGGNGGQSSGGSGGNGNGPGGGTTCPLTTNVTWYGLMPPPDPCGPATPPAGPNPCDTIIAQLQNDANFVYYFHSLTGTGAGQPLSSSTDYEVGFLGQRANNLYIQRNGEPGTGEIDWGQYLTASTKVDFIIHSHYKGLNSIFSAQDMILMAQIFLTGHAKDTASLCFGMTSVDVNSSSINAPMLMKVTDAAAFKLFAQKIAGIDGRDIKVMKKFAKDYESSFNSDDPSANEIGFMQMLKDKGGLFAVGIYRGNAACNSWKKLGLNSGSVTTINCY